MPGIYGTYPIGRYRPHYPQSFINNNTPLIKAPVLVEVIAHVESATLASGATLFPPVLSTTTALAAAAPGIFVSPGALVDVATAVEPTQAIGALPGVLDASNTLVGPSSLLITLSPGPLSTSNTLSSPVPAVVVTPGALDDDSVFVAPSVGQYVTPGALTSADLLVAAGFTISVSAGALVDTSTATAPTLGVSVDAGVLVDIATMLAATITGVSDDTFTVYALNADTGAPSQYTNFAFPGGFADMGDGTLYALDADNLYTVSGTTDASDTIKARIRTGAFSIVQGAQARLDSVDALVDSSGELICKVTAESGDEFAEYWYTPHFNTGGVLQERIYQVNQGIKSRYYMIELATTGGAAGELNHINLYPIPIRRRRSE